MDRREIETLLDQVTYRDWHFYVSERHGQGVYFQVRFWAPSFDGPKNWLRFSRRWFVSEAKTKGDVVKLALKAVLEIEESLATERFLFLGTALFSPFYEAGSPGELCRDYA